LSNEEAKQAFFEQCPVICKGIKYAKITAIIYRLDKYKKLVVSAELLDAGGGSVTIARLQDIERVSECVL
jgi:hypothetical protein